MSAPIAPMSRAAVTCLLLLAVSIFVLGEVLLVRTYRTVDGSPGLSLLDMQMQFEQQSKSLLEARLRTDMREYLDDSELATTLAWIRSGASQKEYELTVAGIIEDSCTKCHQAGGQASFRRLERYEDMKLALSEPPSPPMRSMITTTKVHLVGIGMLIAVPALVVARSRWAKQVGPALVWASYGGLMLDFGAWWLMRIDTAFAAGRGLGHVLLVGGFAALSAMAVATLWAPQEHDA